MQEIEFSARIPVVRECEVLVIGGGPAGIGAAVGAAKSGAKTLLVERYGFLGGNATASLIGLYGGLAPVAAGRVDCDAGDARARCARWFEARAPTTTRSSIGA